MTPTPASILPPLPPATPGTEADHDSLAARQTRNTAQINDDATAFRKSLRAFLGRAYSRIWGRPLKSRQTDADGAVTLVEDPAQRRNENDLSPTEAIEAEGAHAAANFQAYALLLAVAIQIDAANTTHPDTGEDLTQYPAGWSATFAADGSGTAAYTAPAA